MGRMKEEFTDAYEPVFHAATEIVNEWKIHCGVMEIKKWPYTEEGVRTLNRFKRIEEEQIWLFPNEAS